MPKIKTHKATAKGIKVTGRRKLRRMKQRRSHKAEFVREELPMSNEHQTVICQQCGCGFMLTFAYRDFLQRRGARVAVPVQCMTCFSKAGPLPKQHGEVKWFSSRKHYGFITTGEGQDIFFHQNELVQGNGTAPHEGQAAQFHVRHSAKGLEAVNVELAEA